MYLSDGALETRLEDGDLVVSPITDLAQQIQPASIDVRLDNDFLEFERTAAAYIDPAEVSSTDYTAKNTVEDGEDLVLQPGEFILGSTREYVEVPADLLMHVQGRSSIGRLGIAVHATAGIVDPGYKGKITLELSNVGVIPVALRPGMRIGQLLVSELTEPAERPYGTERGSKYQGQTGPEGSKIERDPEYTE